MVPAIIVMFARIVGCVVVSRGAPVFPLLVRVQGCGSVSDDNSGAVIKGSSVKYGLAAHCEVGSGWGVLRSCGPDVAFKGRLRVRVVLAECCVGGLFAILSVPNE